MNIVIAKHILEKHFGKNHPKIDFALTELKQLIKHPLDKIFDEDQIIKSAYQDATEANLENGHCRLCRMVWYNCLCSHDS